VFKRRDSAVPEVPGQRQMVIDREVIRLECAYLDNGVFCERKGIFAATTQGKGPWYCRDHAWVIWHDRRQRQPGED
jgi:hypothetical protein